MKKWSEEIRNTVIRLICEENESTSKVAKSFGIPIKTVENWVTRYNKKKYFPDTETKEDLILRIRKLEKENDILKKTISIVSRIE